MSQATARQAREQELQALQAKAQAMMSRAETARSEALVEAQTRRGELATSVPSSSDASSGWPTVRSAWTPRPVAWRRSSGRSGRAQGRAEGAA